MKNTFLSLLLLASFAISCDAPISKQTPKNNDKKTAVTKSDNKKDTKKSKDDLIKEMLHDTMFTSEFYAAMKQHLNQIASQIDSKDTSKTSEKLYNAFKKHFENSMGKFVEFYNKNFLTEEIQELVNWYKTKTAQKFNKLTSEISQLSMTVSQDALMKAMSEVQSEVKKDQPKTEDRKVNTKKDAPVKKANNAKSVNTNQAKPTKK